MLPALTLAEARRRLADGLSAVELLEAALAAIDDPGGEGSRSFVTVFREEARAEAESADRRRRAGLAPRPLEGLPISVKDLFAVAGRPTTAGSAILAADPPAPADAVAVARLRAAGAVILGRTTMTEFAFSGLGINPHHGTPASPWQRERRRVPGGSSSGAAVSVSDRMALAAIGSDTGGSVRVPAAFCGLAGFKPSSGRHDMSGVFPLAPSLDTIGPLARSIACCRLLDAVMSDAPPPPARPRAIERLTLGVLRRLVFEGCDGEVATAVEDAITRLAAAGARVLDIDVAAVEMMNEMAALGPLVTAEAYHVHRHRLAGEAGRIDPKVKQRLARGAAISAADYIELLRLRAGLRTAFDAATAGLDAVLMPTVAILPPPIDTLAEDEPYFAANAKILRNTTLINLLARPAATIPLSTPGDPPVGLMIVGETGRDSDLIDVAETIEATLARPVS